MKRTNRMTLALCIVTIFTAVGIQTVSAYDPQKDKVPYYMTDDELDKTFGIKADAKMPDDYVRVLYFHRIPGCSTCQTMSKYVYEMILKTYSEQVKNRQVVLRYFNFEDPKNAKLVKTFKIASPSLVLIQGRGGKDIKAKYADKIWSLARDKNIFMKYVGKEIDGYLKPTKQQEGKE